MSERVLRLVLDARKARRHAPSAIELRQRDRLDRLGGIVAFAFQLSVLPPALPGSR